jgi:hypothetical protein
MGIRFVLNKKTIWDNTDFEHILFNNLLGQPDSYLPVKYITTVVVSVGGWKIDVQSTVDWSLRPETLLMDIINCQRN